MLTMISRFSVAAFFVVVVVGVFQQVQGANFIFGEEAERVCEAYKLICPAKKVCALQSIEWPRAMKFPVCVHDTHVVVKSNICRKPPIPGKCKARFMRWYFNVHMGACSWFTYSGCGGNQNKFRTAEECERRCMGTVNEEVEENRPLRQNRHTEAIESAPRSDNLNDVNVDDNVEEKREPKLIPAPARAAEMIDLTTDIKASLQLNSATNNTTTTRKGEKKKRRKEKERKRRLKDKKKRKNRRKNRNDVQQFEITSTIEPAKEVTPYEPQNIDERPLKQTATDQTGMLKLTEWRNSKTTRQGNLNGNERSIWVMDSKFKRRGRRHRNNSNNHHKMSPTDSRHTYSGAKQETYYDKVKLFDILKNQEVEETEKNII